MDTKIYHLTGEHIKYIPALQNLYREIWIETSNAEDKNDEINDEKMNNLFGDKAKWIILVENDYNLSRTDSISSHIIGFMTYGEIRNLRSHNILYNVSINSTFRGKGYGKVLLTTYFNVVNEHLLKNSHTLRIPHYLFVRKDNEIAQNLYHKFGFQINHDFVPLENEICMKKY